MSGQTPERNPFFDNFATNVAVRRALDEFYRRRGAEKLRKKRDARNTVAGVWRQRTAMTLFVTFFVVVGLMVDGLRREAEELCGARFLEMSVPLRIPTLAGGGGSVVAKLGFLLSAGQSVRVDGEDSSENKAKPNAGAASLVFPGGDALRVEQKSVFTLRQLDYARGGARRRLVSLTRGACFLQCGDGETEGSDSMETASRCVVALPGLLRVVARDTALRVAYDEKTGDAKIEVARGVAQVLMASGGVAQIVKSGKTYRFRLGTAKPAAETERGEATDKELEDELLPKARLGVLKKMGDRLRAHQDGGSFLAALERDLLKTFDPLLQRAGLPPGGVGFHATDATRRLATQNALRRLQTVFASLPENGGANGSSALPERLCLSTLAELPLDERSRTEILDACDGATLRSYRCGTRGGETYRIVAAARDSAQTMYELTEAGVRPLASKQGS